MGSRIGLDNRQDLVKTSRISSRKVIPRTYYLLTEPTFRQPRKMNTTEKQSFRKHAASRGSSYQPYCCLAVGLAVAALSSGTLQAQVTLDPAWRVTPDTSKPGFKWSYFQAGANAGNSNERTESDLAGLSPFPNLGDPTVVGAAITEAAPADPANGLLYFEITNVINLSKTELG